VRYLLTSGGIDDETAVAVLDGTPAVVSEGRWHLFPPGGAG